MKCKGNNIGRRGFMHVGVLGGLGLTLGDPRVFSGPI